MDELQAISDGNIGRIEPDHRLNRTPQGSEWSLVDQMMEGHKATMSVGSSCKDRKSNTSMITSRSAYSDQKTIGEAVTSYTSYVVQKCGMDAPIRTRNHLDSSVVHSASIFDAFNNRKETQVVIAPAVIHCALEARVFDQS